VAQEVGISLAEIGKALASLPGGRTPTRDDWNVLSQQWAADLDRRILQLQKLRNGLTDCIGCGCLSIDRCKLRNPGDRLAEEGPGPRRLVVAPRVY
jgi:MerR family redox-sensitive transcriptional activator SoxR